MITVGIEGLSVTVDKLNQFKSPKLRRSILLKAGRHIVKVSKARIASQTDLSGAPFAPAADGSGRRVLVGKSKTPGIRSLLKIIEANAESATVGWSNPVYARIAAEHQFGAKKPTREGKAGDKTKSATRKQAKALIEVGYKKRRAKGGYQTPSIKWITENMNRAQAGKILRLLKGTPNKGVVTIPARSFFGFTDDDLLTLANILNQEVEAALNGTQ